MDMMKNEMPIRCSRRLDSTNYSYWKIHMSVFIKSLGFKVWKSINTGLSVPTKLVNGETMIKPMSNWNCKERKAASRNFTALHAIQKSIDDKMLGLIVTSESAKDAWDTLHTVFEESRCIDPKKEESGKNFKRA